MQLNGLNPDTLVTCYLSNLVRAVNLETAMKNFVRACCSATLVVPGLDLSLDIIPYKRSSDCTSRHLLLGYLIVSLPFAISVVTAGCRESSKLQTLNDVNGIRNGVFASHTTFDKRQLVILKVGPLSLLILHLILVIAEDVSYPSLETLSELATSAIPNNVDATFKKGTKKLKPSGLLLHYSYGVAAAKCWGHGIEILRTHANPPPGYSSWGTEERRPVRKSWVEPYGLIVGAL